MSFYFKSSAGHRYEVHGLLNDVFLVDFLGGEGFDSLDLELFEFQLYVPSKSSRHHDFEFKLMYIMMFEVWCY